MEIVHGLGQARLEAIGLGGELLVKTLYSLLPHLGRLSCFLGLGRLHVFLSLSPCLLTCIGNIDVIARLRIGPASTSQLSKFSWALLCWSFGFVRGLTLCSLGFRLD